MKRGIIGIAFVCLMLVLPLASAGIFDFLGRKVQLGPSETQDFSVSVSGVAPVVDVMPTTGISSAIIEEFTGTATIIFQVSDGNGATDVNMDGGSEAIAITITSPGAETRTATEADCSITATVVTNGFEYECDIEMQYYDEAGDWDVDVSVTDASTDVGTADDSGEDANDLTVSQLRAIKVDPASIGFGSVNPEDVDTESGSDTTITNIGNFVVDDVAPATDLTITAVGLTNGVDNIPVTNFKSVDVLSILTDSCATDAVVADHSGTAVTITNFDLAKGTQATPIQTRNLRHCLTLVPAGISPGTYNTGGAGWTFAI
jgi:hypothetical protein